MTPQPNLRTPDSMLIAVNTRLLLKDKLEGIGRFTHETLKRITVNHPEHEFLFLFDRKFSPEFIYSNNITPVVLSPPARHPLLWYWWFEFSLPKFFKVMKPDLFLSPDGYLSLKANVPSLPVIHDINFEHYPKSLPPLFSWYYRQYFPQYARKATRIATVSKFSKNDIAKTYSIHYEKIDVVFNGINDGFKPLDESKIQQTRNRCCGGAPYFLFTGAIHERKNIVNLLKAYDLFRTTNPGNVKLLLAGNRKWWSNIMETTLNEMKHKDDVIFTGRVSDEELQLLPALRWQWFMFLSSRGSAFRFWRRCAAMFR
ncbi:MAG: glycosyltransferase family 4 protein [Bacteroidia bacterium]|nr:glycosyltransferase family 4 protein [Bacteroidia bacterium]